MIRLAFRNLFQNKIRLVISVGGVAMALLLILSLDAIFAGVERQITAYVDNSGADIFVSQSGVQNMHMAASSLPVIDINEVKGVLGVQAVTPIHYTTNMIVIGADRNLAYIIGLPENAEMGGPWKISTGSGHLNSGEAVIDRSVAEKTGISIGNNVDILGRKFKVVGLSEGTTSLINSVAFISMADFAAVRGSPETVSYLLVKVKPGVSPNDVVERIKTQLGDVTVQLTSDFAAQERRVVKDMSTDVINIMNLIGFFIGLGVMALTVYTATLTRRAEYGVLKALGACNRHLYQAVLAQALFSVAIGFGVGVVFTWLLSAVIPRLGLNLTLIINGESLLKVGAVSLVIASFSALLPIRQIAGLDPAMVFRGNKMTTSILQVTHATKRYGSGSTEVIAVSDVSLSVGPGEIVLIMGPSGSGKTTLLSMLGALLKPTDGVIQINGDVISALAENRLPDIRLRQFGFVFQDFNLLSALSAMENVAIVAELGGMKGGAARKKAAALLTELGLGERLNFLPEKLSGGEKQRVAIARALINDPALILADEPTANLDSKIGHEIMRLLRRIAKEQGRSVVIVSHDQRIKDIADRVLWLEDGQFREMVTMATDPVCGMTVEREKAISLEWGGQVFYFCARGCRDEFFNNPDEYIRDIFGQDERKSV